MATHSLARMLSLLLCVTAAKTSRAELAPDAVFGGITYPAKGNIQLDEGTLDLWVISNFDTDYEIDKSPADHNWRACLFNLLFPEDNSHYVLQYISWGRGFAMIGYAKPPQPYVWAGPNHWKPGEAHHVVFTWSGTKRSVFIDGICEWKGGKGLNIGRDVDVQLDLHGDLTAALIQIGAGSSHITVDEVQIRRVALTPEEIIRAKNAPLVADVYTLLLDHCDGGPPEIIASKPGKEATQLIGTYEVVDGKFGKAVRLWKENK